MTPEFDDWWDGDELTKTNPYDDGSTVWWAWEGWLAATKRMQGLLDEAYADADEVLRPRIAQLESQIAEEREACAKVCDRDREGGVNDRDESWAECANYCAAAIRARSCKP